MKSADIFGLPGHCRIKSGKEPVRKAGRHEVSGKMLVGAAEPAKTLDVFMFTEEDMFDENDEKGRGFLPGYRVNMRKNLGAKAGKCDIFCKMVIVKAKPVGTIVEDVEMMDKAKPVEMIVEDVEMKDIYAMEY
mmetsp:Transcript_27715/g.82730  ORF Transcript_27715/g.82730 Transcript_27715/m.82730 type:complete len:133 (+) Transcript_27715:144-542(+)